MLFLHIIGIALWFGATLGLALVTARAARSGNAAIASFAFRVSYIVLRGPGLTGMVLTIISGFGLNGIGRWPMFQPVDGSQWLFLMQVLGLAAFGLALAVQIPTARVLAMSRPEEIGTPSYETLRKRHALSASVAGSLVLIVTLLGAMRPF